MNSLIQSLNLWGTRFPSLALAVLWQSTVLIAVVFAFDFLFRRKVRPAVRYTLWLVVLVKLMLPPTLALPSGVAWWLRGQKTVTVTPKKILKVTQVRVADEFNAVSAVAASDRPTPAPKLSGEAWMIVGWLGVSGFLLAWVAFRWREIARSVRDTSAPLDAISEMMAVARSQAGIRRKVTLRVTAGAVSPAVCGLFRPIILLPQSLVERLSATQLRAVLLHELIHLRRQDVWVNCAQTLLQIIYWWHPLLWFANARARRVREEAVDDAVMVALSEDAEVYAPTLLEVAKLAFHRPLASLGLIGILESRNALRQRIERLLNFTTPRSAGISAVSLAGIVAFSAVAVPMGEPPVRLSPAGDISDATQMKTFHTKVDTQIFLRNIKARAGETMHSPTDEWSDILSSILDGYGVNSAPPRSIALNEATGDIAVKNSPEALGVIDEVLRELNLPGGERVLNSPYNLKQVLIEVQFYRIPLTDFVRLNLSSDRSHRDLNSSTWWGFSQAQLNDVQQRIKELGLQSLSSPRIRTSEGITADLSVLDGTNNIEVECVPSIRDSFLKITTLVRTTGKYGPESGRWPDFGEETNCAIFARANFPDGGGAVFRAENAGASVAGGELIVLLRARVVNPVATVSNKVSADRLLQDGKSLYEAGKLDAAEAKLQKVLTIQTNNEAAIYYLSLIKQARIRKIVDEHNLSGPRFVRPMYPLDSTNSHARSIKVDTDSATPEVTVKVWFVEADANYDGLNAVLTNGFGNSTNGLSPTATGALDDAAFQTVLKKLRKNDRVKLLNEGEVTTLSGRKANFQVVNLETVVIGRDKTTNATGSSAGYATTNIPVGLTVDLVATVLPDGYSISLIATPSLIKIAGYHESPDMVDYNKPGHPPLQMPVFSTQTATFTTTLQDGQIMVIAGLSDNTETAEPNTAVSPQPFTEKGKQLLIFIRPVIIDAVGNRVHRDEQIHSKDYYDQPVF